MEAYVQTTHQVTDAFLRSILISACQDLENGISSGRITQTTDISMRTRMGLMVKVEYYQKDPEKPIIFLFRYGWDMTALKKWAANNMDLLEGVFFTTQKGIEVCLLPGKINSPSFTIEEDMGRISLALNQNQEIFKVHREITRGTEWVVALER